MPEDRPDDHVDRDGAEPDEERHPRAVHDAREDVAARRGRCPRDVRGPGGCRIDAKSVLSGSSGDDERREDRDRGRSTSGSPAPTIASRWRRNRRTAIRAQRSRARRRRPGRGRDGAVNADRQRPRRAGSRGSTTEYGDVGDDCWRGPRTCRTTRMTPIISAGSRSRAAWTESWPRPGQLKTRLGDDGARDELRQQDRRSP